MKLIFTLMIAAFIFVGQATADSMCVNQVSMQAPSNPVCLEIPGLGDKIILPDGADFVARVLFEDLNALLKGVSVVGLPGDGDFDDAAVWIIGDWLTRQIRMIWAGLPNLAMYHNIVSPVGYDDEGVSSVSDPDGIILTVPWVPDQELVLQNRAVYEPFGVDDIFYTGPGNRNFDGGIHAIVEMTVIPVEEPEAIPEPSTFLLIGGGLVAIALYSNHRRRA